MPQVFGVMSSANVNTHVPDDSIQAIELTTLPDPSLAAASAAVIVASKGSLDSSTGRGRSVEAGCEVKRTSSAEGVETQVVNEGSNEAETKQRSTWRLVMIMIALFVSADSVYCGWQNRTPFRC
jgi:hypothetical protein